MKNYSLLLLFTLFVSACGQSPEEPPLPIDAEKFANQREQAGRSVEKEVQRADPVSTEKETVTEEPASDKQITEEKEVKLTHDQAARRAIELSKNGDFSEAISVLKEAVTNYPRSAQLYALRSDIHRQDRNVEASLDDISVAIELNSESASYHVGRAQLYISLERMQEAEADLNKAIELEPDLIAGYFNRGTLYAHLGQHEKALGDLDTCINKAPAFAAPYFNRASVLDHLGRRQEAIADVERFIELADDEEWKKIGRDQLLKWK
ncbi:hypothetical protein BOV90_04165 [Solemya velum gill symbiont]|uniref:tetratricopeptide repeat protein n=1 Tax=Solemya velum gill symbiont TaxID=2340 RepID=UPI000996FB76|nr:tetratricopeptide repeat protein [Solemya velum gill symbiont]OOY40427.1 hypothetical protein BOV90_04165 [Solemya velum gill symbiont]OOY45169.1 hypothetical protein BOV92_06335 [Solemya velum gill symbiont]